MIVPTVRPAVAATVAVFSAVAPVTVTLVQVMSGVEQSQLAGSDASESESWKPLCSPSASVTTTEKSSVSPALTALPEVPATLEPVIVLVIASGSTSATRALCTFGPGKLWLDA